MDVPLEENYSYGFGTSIPLRNGNRGWHELKKICKTFLKIQKATSVLFTSTMNHISTYAAGKFASARTISSPCPMLAMAWSKSGDKIFGIPFKRPIFSRNMYKLTADFWPQLITDIDWTGHWTEEFFRFSAGKFVLIRNLQIATILFKRRNLAEKYGTWVIKVLKYVYVYVLRNMEYVIRIANSWIGCQKWYL